MNTLGDVDNNSINRFVYLSGKPFIPWKFILITAAILLVLITCCSFYCYHVCYKTFCYKEQYIIDESQDIITIEIPQEEEIIYNGEEGL